jgi:hypothetical protein
MAAFAARAGGSLFGAAAAGNQRAAGVIWAQEDWKNSLICREIIPRAEQAGLLPVYCDCWQDRLSSVQRALGALRGRGLIERSTLSSKAVYASTDPVFELWISRNGRSLLRGGPALRPPGHRKTKH